MSERPIRRPTTRAAPRKRVTTRDVGLAIAEKTLEAKAALEERGLFLPRKPGDEYPELPEDPTALDDSELMQVFFRFTAWADYLGGQLALAEIDERLCQAMLAKTEDVVLLRKMPSSEALRKREDTMTRAKAELSNDKEVIERAEAHATAYAMKKLLTGMFERADRDSAALSRELTRRTEGANPRVRRARRWGT